MQDLSESLIINLAQILECSPIELSKSTVLHEFPAWDSLAHISTVTMLDTEFGILISEEEFRKINTILDIENLITNQKS